MHAKAVAVMDHNGARLMRELIAARDIFWTLTKQASGFFLLDEKRPGGPRFAALKTEIEIQIDRHRSTIQEHPELRENWKLMQYTDAQNADAARQWSDYFRRLCGDAEARFDDREEFLSMKLVRLRMNACDEVNHGGERFPVSNSGRHLGVGEVEVPKHVADVLLAVSAGAELIQDEPPPSPPPGFVCPNCGWRKEFLNHGASCSTRERRRNLIQPDGSLRHMTGEVGPAGAAGLGSGVVCVVSSAGSFIGTPVGTLIAQLNTIGLPPPLNRRFVVDLATSSVNWFGVPLWYPAP